MSSGTPQAQTPKSRGQRDYCSFSYLSNSFTESDVARQRLPTKKTKLTNSTQVGRIPLPLAIGRLKRLKRRPRCEAEESERGESAGEKREEDDGSAIASGKRARGGKKAEPNLLGVV